MRILLLVLLLAPGAGAVDAEPPGAPALRARDAIERLPLRSRRELRRMYLRYRDGVARRLDQGWKPGLLSDAVIEDVAEPFQPARLLEAEEKSRRRSLAEKRAALATTAPESPDYDLLAQRVQDAQNDVARARRKNSREKGICRDWSDDAWSALTKMGLDRWTVDDRRREARPFHSAAVACSPPENPAVCLAFDPWADGSPSVYAYPAWNAQDSGGRLPADYFLHGLPEKAPRP